MLGAIIILLLIAAAAYAVTQIGGVITLLFIAAILFLAYRRLSLLALRRHSPCFWSPTPGWARRASRPGSGKGSSG